MNKDVRKLMKQAQRQGFEIRRGGKHWITRVDQIAKMRELTGRALDGGLFDGEWTVEDVEIVARAAAAAALVHEVMKEVGEEATNIGVDEDKRVPVEAETQVCDCWAEKE